uniref:phosphoserine phosphatase n=1 Tax=Chenopodium quinoa TaxID=63459 RepID=A0A803L9J1_CHEQI
MEALLSAHVVKVPVCHVKQCNYSLLTPSPPRLIGKLHRSAFGMMNSSKLTNSVTASIQPVEASTTERFDNTLPSKDEGIDEFAEFCGAGKAVAEWTSRAMNGSVTFQEALAARLSLINPTLSQLQDYLEKRPPRLSPGIAELVRKLKAKGVDVYLVSGGFRQMINPVASILEIPIENIFANQMLFEDSGEFLGFDENEPTSRSGGKPIAVQQIRKARGYNTLAMIGDGATDLEARQPGGADLFICFAGVQLREAVAAKADWLVFNFKDLINSLD